MKRWEVAVWVTIHGRRVWWGNWWERRFQSRWVAYRMMRLMAILCDLRTPDNGCCYNVRYGMRRVPYAERKAERKAERLGIPPSPATPPAIQ